MTQLAHIASGWCFCGRQSSWIIRGTSHPSTWRRGPPREHQDTSPQTTVANDVCCRRRTALSQQQVNVIQPEGICWRPGNPVCPDHLIKQRQHCSKMEEAALAASLALVLWHVCFMSGTCTCNWQRRWRNTNLKVMVGIKASNGNHCLLSWGRGGGDGKGMHSTSNPVLTHF